jgi:hypothetical protein
MEPRWSQDGRELFYLGADGLMSVPVTTAPAFGLGVPKLVFQTPFRSPKFTNNDHMASVRTGSDSS